MTIARDRLIVSSLTGDVTAFGISDQAQRWRFNGHTGSAGFAIAADREDVYVPYLGGRLIALAIADGRERWRTTSEHGAFMWAPTSDGATVFAAGADSVTAFDR